MGLRLAMDLDTNLGNSQDVYVRIENINVNKTFRRIQVATTLWLSKSTSDLSKEEGSPLVPFGLIDKHVVSYEDIVNNPLGTELDLPVFFEFDLDESRTSDIYCYCYEKVEQVLSRVLNSKSIEEE